MTVENWDRVAEEFQGSPPLNAWRGYMKEIYGRLTKRWLRTAPPGRCLKTDLFEEAICLQHPMADLPEGSVGMDGSIGVVASAKNHLAPASGFHLLVSDLRQSPIRPGTLASILSGSSLDHFETEEELTSGLAEVTAGLAPGGVLVLTLDNPRNPLIWIRNHLPYRWLHRLGLVPYFVGRTWSRNQARKQLEELGLEVTAETAVAHVPRAPAIWLDSLTRGWRSDLFERMLIRAYLAFEALEPLPTRYLTGYYVAIRAVQATTRRTRAVDRAHSTT
jgi:SAM-dependent methyltransferase